MSAAVENPYWMPFTANRDFKKNPRIVSGAEGHHYIAACREVDGVELAILGES